MSQERPPLGVTIVHQYYAGFIDVPPGTQYLINSSDLKGAVHVLNHVRPLIVTDFDNELVRRPLGKNLMHTDIRRPITGVEHDSVALDGSGYEGRTAPMIAIEYSITGRVFLQEVYTSLHVCSEFFDAACAENLTNHRLLRERFIGAYRYINPDTRLLLTNRIADDDAPLRVGCHYYSPAEQTQPFEKRIVHAWPERLSISIISSDRAARALQDHVGDEAALRWRSMQLNSYLANGFALSENLLEVERIVDLAFKGKRPRAAIVEGMSVLEMSILAHQRRMNVQLGSRVRTNEPTHMTWKVLIEKLLPRLLDLYEGDASQIMARAKKVLDIRHRVVHGGYTPSNDEVNMILSFIRSVLSIFELPDAFRAGWQLK